MANSETSPGSTGLTQVRPWTARAAWDARETLLDALKDAGITLPSVELEPGALESPLISLGRARPDVVKALAAVIRKGGKAHE
jgi:hypothetical protein